VKQSGWIRDKGVLWRDGVRRQSATLVGPSPQAAPSHASGWRRPSLSAALTRRISSWGRGRGCTFTVTDKRDTVKEE
jgi:hypothetical protein